MKLSQFFKSSKDFQLDKNTFVNLRWIALLGQFAAVNVVKLVFQFDFYFLACNLIVGIGVLTNLFLQFSSMNFILFIWSLVGLHITI